MEMARGNRIDEWMHGAAEGEVVAQQQKKTGGANTTTRDAGEEIKEKRNGSSKNRFRNPTLTKKRRGGSYRGCTNFRVVEVQRFK